MSGMQSALVNDMAVGESKKSSRCYQLPTEAPLHRLLALLTRLGATPEGHSLITCSTYLQHLLLATCVTRNRAQGTGLYDRRDSLFSHLLFGCSRKLVLSAAAVKIGSFMCGDCAFNSTTSLVPHCGYSSLKMLFESIPQYKKKN